MASRLITSVAVAALLASGGIVHAQGGQGGRQEAQAPGGGAGKAGGDRADKRGGEGGGGGQRADKAGGAGGGQRADKAGGGTGMDKDKGGARADQGAGDKAKSGKMGAKGDRDDKMGGDTDKGGKRAANRDDMRKGDKDRPDRADKGGRPDVRVSIRVGAIAPEGRRMQPLDETIIKRYPQYRGYESFVENGQVVIIEPGTRKIVRTVSEGMVGEDSRATNCR